MINKKLFFILGLICFMGMCGRIYAVGPLGIGIIAGEPSGICAKLWVNEFFSIDSVIAYSFFRGGLLYVHLDLQYYLYNIINTEEVRFPLYTGIGSRIIFDEPNDIVGIRIPVGIDLIFKQFPLDFFIEIAPGLDLYPAVGFAMGEAIGVRYYF